MHSAIVVGLLLLAITAQHFGLEVVTHDSTRVQLGSFMVSSQVGQISLFENLEQICY